ncbi:hypothetical protein [Facilibium subflavum]|uniref:hypothetical protein n=1 Tax=Facilibium subflavum TaxID=2219058 RepID=UPI000E64EB47|nr:hypothetical protein [Facilibium subflavum]
MNKIRLVLLTLFPCITTTLIYFSAFLNGGHNLGAAFLVAFFCGQLSALVWRNMSTTRHSFIVLNILLLVFFIFSNSPIIMLLMGFCLRILEPLKTILIVDISKRLKTLSSKTYATLFIIVNMVTVLSIWFVDWSLKTLSLEKTRGYVLLVWVSYLTLTVLFFHKRLTEEKEKRTFFIRKASIMKCIEKADIQHVIQFAIAVYLINASNVYMGVMNSSVFKRLPLGGLLLDSSFILGCIIAYLYLQIWSVIRTYFYFGVIISTVLALACQGHVYVAMCSMLLSGYAASIGVSSSLFKISQLDNLDKRRYIIVAVGVLQILPTALSAFFQQVLGISYVFSMQALLLVASLIALSVALWAKKLEVKA